MINERDQRTINGVGNRFGMVAMAHPIASEIGRARLKTRTAINKTAWIPIDSLPAGACAIDRDLGCQRDSDNDCETAVSLPVTSSAHVPSSPGC